MNIDMNGFKSEHGPIAAIPHSGFGDLTQLNINEVPTEFRLFPNFPNPFNEFTTIQFDLPKTIGDLVKERRLGLAGMQERAQLVSGSLKIESEPGQGTTVTIEAPL